MRILKRKLLIKGINKEIEIKFSKVSLEEFVPKARVLEIMNIWTKVNKSKQEITELLAFELIEIISKMNWYELACKILTKHLISPKIESLDKICSKSEFQIRKELIKYIIKESLVEK